jgi:hypothetical protein
MKLRLLIPRFRSPFQAAFTITLTLITFVGIAQPINQIMSSYFNQVRLNNFPAIPKPLTIGDNADETLAALAPYFKDTSNIVRAKAYAIAQLAGTASRTPSVRLTYAMHLVNACKDVDAGNVGIALDYLTTFSKKDFTPAALDTVRSLVRRKTPHMTTLVRLAGFLNVTGLESDLAQMTKPGNPQQLRWAALVALSRMGNTNATLNVMSRVQRLPVNDDVVYKVFPDLVYTRQRQALDYLVQVMQSDEKNCFSADVENEIAIPCGYRIMEQLALAVKNYPVMIDAGGDIQTKDYNNALQTVRTWFNSHKHYEIDTSTY